MNIPTWKIINEIDCNRWFYMNSNKWVKKEKKTKQLEQSAMFFKKKR